MILSVPKDLQKKLLFWFENNRRSLPWRGEKDPYKIWISEVLLQQTTSRAVIPYYRKFLKKFPNISSLARAGKKDLLSLWSGLGYYKRVDSLLRSAKILNKKQPFPKTYKELEKLPGFGPYTARAVSSIAFEEAVGVLDGNVIRFLSRFYGRPFKYWLSLDKAQLQALSDLWTKDQKASQINQALMEIGALVCLSKNPLCLSCPLAIECRALKMNLQNSLPLKKPKKSTEFWYWRAEKIRKNTSYAFVENKSLPFLKKRLIFPGTGKKIKHKAKNYDFSHSIMHYQIFVCVQNKDKGSLRHSVQWLTRRRIRQLNPSSLIRKILDH